MSARMSDDVTSNDEVLARQLQAQFDTEVSSGQLDSARNSANTMKKRSAIDTSSDSDKTVSEDELDMPHCAKKQRSDVTLSTGTVDVPLPPACRYGSSCYRKNELHLQQFWHPPPSQQTGQNAMSGKLYLTKVSGIRPEYNSEKIAIGIKDILSETMGTLISSVQFNYMFDITWLIQQYPPEHRDKPLLIVHGEKQQAKRDLEQSASRYSNIRLCQAPIPELFGTHHTKMMMLLYKEGLRVIVHTANLIEGDWHQKTQGVWMSPLFLKKASSVGDADSETSFKHDLLQYIKAYGAKELTEWVAIIDQYDFASSRVFLIASVPGRHIGNHRNAFGHLKLRSVLMKHITATKATINWPVVAQFSSIGSLGPSSSNWLATEWLSSLSATMASVSPSKELKLIFPSVDNVRCSLEGYPAGASLPYSKETAAKQPWLNTFLHQWKSDKCGRSAASPHIKTYMRISPDASKSSWMLITSANLSKAAWGNLEKNESHLHIRSYELGVLFLPQKWGKDMFNLADTNCDLIIPFDLPPKPYAIEDKPWTFNDQHIQKPDRHGNVWAPPKR